MNRLLTLLGVFFGSSSSSFLTLHFNWIIFNTITSMLNSSNFECALEIDGNEWAQIWNFSFDEYQIAMYGAYTEPAAYRR